MKGRLQNREFVQRHTEGAPSRTRVSVILNAGSGHRLQHEAAERLKPLLQRQGIENPVHIVHHGRDICASARAALRRGSEVVIAGGGDGTLSAVASVLAGTGCAMGVLPLGTFNYFARSLRIPLELEDALQVCLEGKIHQATMGEINGRMFLNNASLGLYPEVLSMREETYRRWGRTQWNAYGSVLLTIVRKHAHLHARVVVEGREQCLRTPLIFVANNKFQIDSFKLLGSGCMEGGMMPLYVVPSVSRIGLLRLAWRMMRRCLNPEEDFRAVCIDEATIETRRKFLQVACDGENERMRSPFRLRLHQNALRVLVPRPDTEEQI